MAAVPVETKKTAPAAMSDPFRSLRSEMDRLFDRFAAGFRMPSWRSMFDTEPAWPYEGPFSFPTPAAEVAEADKMFKITAEPPGLEQKDIQVTVSGDLLTEGREALREGRKGPAHVRARLRLLPTLFHAAGDDGP